MANRTGMMIGAILFALVGTVGAHAGVAIDNAASLDPYDPVPPIAFSHWYGGGCYRECGERCEHSCTRRADCDESCRHHRDCGERGCYNDVNTYVAPCTSGDCDESVRWERKWRDGNHVSDEWSDSGSHQGERREHYRHRFDNDDDEDYGQQPEPH